MNRLSDIKATLSKNLDDNAADCDQIEFIVIVFDRSPNTFEFIIANYSDELKDGYLRVYHRPDNLNFWHFGKAKNVFKPYINGKIYSSLDGDNFTGRRGGNHIIRVFEDYDYNCIYHQFQGVWGDGTCGRISVTREDYMEIGYDESFFPRQWDDLDIILSTLVGKPERKYICYSGGNIIEKSDLLKHFLAENSILPITVEISQNSFGKSYEKNYAIGHKNILYGVKDIKLKLFTKYNGIASCMKNCKSFAQQEEYLKKIQDCQQELLDNIPENAIVDYCLAPDFNEPVYFHKGVKLVACIKDEPLMREWVRHYKNLGVESFFLIDDRSQIPLSTVLKDEPGVFIWKPEVGSFRHAKNFWLEMILNLYCIDSWTYIVDGDEFVELPVTDTTIPNKTEDFVSNCENIHCYGFLLDVFPSGIEAYWNYSYIKGQSVSYDSMTHYQYRSDNNYARYKENQIVTDVYSKFYEWAYRIDIGYRLNRSRDCLGKFLLVKWAKGMQLNQGLDKFIDEKNTVKKLSSKSLLPIRHLKYYKLFYLAANRSSENFHTYYSDAGINAENVLDITMKSCVTNPFAYKFIHAKLVPTPFRKQILILDSYDIISDDLQICNSDMEIFQFRQSYSDKIRVKDTEIFGPSLTMVLFWLKKSTPFKHQRYMGSGLYTLSCE